MLRLSLLSFALGILAMILGLGNLGGISFELGRTFFLFLIAVALAAFVMAVTLHSRTGERRPALGRSRR